MGNPIIATPVLSDAATITASSELSAAPVTNLQRQQPTDLWRTDTLTGIYIEIDFGSAVDWNSVWLFHTNATSAADWRIRAATSQANLTASPTYDSTTIDFPASATDEDRVHGLLWYSTGVTARWLRIDITDAANPDGYFEAGRLFVADAWQSSRGQAYPPATGFNDYSESRRSPGGQLITDPITPAPAMEFRLAYLSEDEMLNNAWNIARTRGGSRDVACCTDPDTGTHRHKKMIHGLLQKQARITNPVYSLFEQQFVIEGLI